MSAGDRGRISTSRFSVGFFQRGPRDRIVSGEIADLGRGDGRRSGRAPRLPVLNSIAPMAPCSVETNARMFCLDPANAACVASPRKDLCQS